MNGRRKKFVAAYFKEPNATKAAISAGYSTKTAYSIGQQLLKEPEIVKALGKKFDKLDLTTERVVRETMLLGFSNMLDYLRIDEGEPRLDFSALTRDQAAAIQEIREDTTGGAGDGERKLVLRTTFKLADKTKALDMLMRHLGAYNDKLQLTGLEGLAIGLSEIRKAKLASS